MMSLLRLAALAAALSLVAGPASAYIGPGAGLSVVAAFWALLTAVVSTLLFLALWPIRFVATGNDLAQVQAKLVKDAATIKQLLSSAGLTDKDIELQRLDVTDLLAQAYRSGPVDSRFIVAQTLMARSTNVDQISAAGQRLSELVDAGIVLSNEFGPGAPVYRFTKLNDIKPEMVAEATRDARRAAEQFAEDSDTGVGGIKQATQGYFEITARDGDGGGWGVADTPFKKVRVVTTIDFYLR